VAPWTDRADATESPSSGCSTRSSRRQTDRSRLLPVMLGLGWRPDQPGGSGSLMAVVSGREFPRPGCAPTARTGYRALAGSRDRPEVAATRSSWVDQRDRPRSGVRGGSL